MLLYQNQRFLKDYNLYPDAGLASFTESVPWILANAGVAVQVDRQRMPKKVLHGNMFGVGDHGQRSPSSWYAEVVAHTVRGIHRCMSAKPRPTECGEAESGDSALIGFGLSRRPTR